MQASLRYISVNHHKASTSIRQSFYLNEQEQEALIASLQESYSDISSLMILSTCNRVEVYFEAEITTAQQVAYFLLAFKHQAVTAGMLKTYFDVSDATLDTAKHLMKVANGLDSRISGDAQIINQVKTAYARSVEAALQGKLLERAIQAAFRLHKKISNETHFRKGTVSFGMLSLKHISHDLGKDQLNSKRLLIAGAGEIAEEVAKYAVKFAFKEIYITNRTHAKAEKLAAKYQLKVAEWSLVEQNQLHEFDAVVSCVSNRANLIKAEAYVPALKPMVFIDLAMPANIEVTEAPGGDLYLYDLDTLSGVKDSHLEAREAARHEAENLLAEELQVFAGWIGRLPVYQALSTYQQDMENEIKTFLLNRYLAVELPAVLVEDISKSLAKKLTRKPARKLMDPGLDDEGEELLQVFKALFNEKL